MNNGSYDMYSKIGLRDTIVLLWINYKTFPEKISVNEDQRSEFTIIVPV